MDLSKRLIRIAQEVGEGGEGNSNGKDINEFIKKYKDIVVTVNETRNGTVVKLAPDSSYMRYAITLTSTPGGLVARYTPFPTTDPSMRASWTRCFVATLEIAQYLRG